MFHGTVDPMGAGFAIGLLCGVAIAMLCQHFFGDPVERSVAEEAWRRLNGMISRYPRRAPGDGTDMVAERNGLVLAANVIADLLRVRGERGA